MAYVPVPNDLSRIKTKLAFNLTKRQLICFSISFLAVYGILHIGLPNARLFFCRYSRLFLTFVTAPFVPIIDGEIDGARL